MPDQGGKGSDSSRGLAPRKHLGQNFLKDRHVIRQIVAAAGLPDQVFVLEIGPGQGALTDPVWDMDPPAWWGIEADGRCVELLKQKQEKHPLAGAEGCAERFRVVHQDVLTCNLHTVESGIPDLPRVVLGNLPYHISTAILCRILPCMPAFARCVLMFQKEVADRVAASPGSRAYGRLSVMAQAVADVRTVCTVRPGAFFPVPGVDSAVLLLTPARHPLVQGPESWKQLESLVRQAFSQRRKQIRNTLAPLWPPGVLLSVLERVGISPMARPEELSPASFVSLLPFLPAVL